MDFVRQYIKEFAKQKWYEQVFFVSTVLLVVFYLSAYTIAKNNPILQRYLPLFRTLRTLFLSAILLFFYNPLRSSFEFGRALPIFAFSAGITILLLVDRYDILNLLHFLLYGDVLPPNPKKECRFVNDATGEEIHTIQQ
jgi:hypothetical protein